MPKLTPAQAKASFKEAMKKPPLQGSPIVLGGIVAKGASSIVKTIIANAVKKHARDAEKVGQQVAKDVAAHLKRPTVSAKSPTKVTVKTDTGSSSSSVSTSGGTSIGSSTKSVSYMSKGKSEAQAASSQRGLDTARNAKINVAANSAKSASMGIAEKAVGTGFKAGQKVGKIKGFVAGAATAVVVDKAVEKSKKGK